MITSQTMYRFAGACLAIALLGTCLFLGGCATMGVQ